MIYLDNAATTKTHEDVVKEMLPYFTENYGNASSVYDLGSKSKLAITKSRETIAAALNAKPEEIYFTAGGSESDNWALKATAEAYKNKGKHIITSKIEHHAILHTCEYLEREGYEITYLDVDERGLVDVEELKQAIRPDTILISVMFANNEIGIHRGRVIVNYVRYEGDLCIFRISLYIRFLRPFTCIVSNRSAA